MEVFMWWYISGIVGLCLCSYVDCEHDASNEHLLEYLVVAIFGVIWLGVGIYAMYLHIKDTRKRNPL